MKPSHNKGRSKNVSDNRTQYSENVDGKRVEARSYPKREWRDLTPSQRAAVVRLNKKRKSDRYNNRKAEIKSTTTETQPTCNDTNDETQDEQKPKVTWEKQKAQSGQVGKFLSRSRV